MDGQSGHRHERLPRLRARPRRVGGRQAARSRARRIACSSATGTAGTPRSCCSPRSASATCSATCTWRPNHGVVVVAYTDEATGVMEETGNGGGHFTSVTLRPRVTVLERGDARDRSGDPPRGRREMLHRGLGELPRRSRARDVRPRLIPAGRRHHPVAPPRRGAGAVVTDTVGASAARRRAHRLVLSGPATHRRSPAAVAFEFGFSFAERARCRLIRRSSVSRSRSCDELMSQSASGCMMSSYDDVTCKPFLLVTS